MSEFNTSRREGSVKFGYDFMTSTEVVKLFGPEVSKSAFSSGFMIPGLENTLCWMVKEVGGNRWHNIPTRGWNHDGRGYRQVVSIKEYNEDAEVSRTHVEKELANPVRRYVFWNEKNDGVSFFKFHGVFELDVEETRGLMEAGDCACIYRKTYDEGACPQADYEVRDIPTGELGRFAGKNLVVELLTALEQTDATKPDVRLWPGDVLKVKEVVPGAERLVCTTSRGIEVVVPKRELELGYMRLEGSERKRPESLKTAERCTPEEFERFWAETGDFFGLEGDEENLVFKDGACEHTLRCRWDDGNVVVALASPMSTEWDYAQLYRGMFGWGDVGEGFHDKETRAKVAKLLLDEILRRKKWLADNPDAVAQREKEIRGSEMPTWFERYRWTRNRMAQPGEGDLRLYVKGVNRLWGDKIHCEWALSDLSK